MPCVCLLSRFVKDFGPARVIGSLQFGSVGFLLGAQGFPGGTSRKEPANAADVIDQVPSLGGKDPLEEGMATRSSVLA